jgi:beta-glucanase (GH16 family)
MASGRPRLVVVLSGLLLIVTACSDRTGGMGAGTTSGPVVTAAQSVVTTTVPVATTRAPVVTTAVPVVTTAAPVSVAISIAPVTRAPSGGVIGVVGHARAGLAAPIRPVSTELTRSGTGGTSPTGVGGKWSLRFDDEFNGAALDRSKWSTGWLAPGVTPPVNSDEQECYDPRRVSQSGGQLRLTVVSSPCTVDGKTYAYRSGMINTDGKAEFTYGFFEARIYLPGAGGTIVNWPAWWTDGQNWPADGEMDILEGLDGQACWHFHSDAGGPGGCADVTFVGWHTYAADWEPGSVTYYYDGVEVGRVVKGITAHPMFLILNDAVNARGQGQTAAPSTMEVDYVRVWSKG